MRAGVALAVAAVLAVPVPASAHAGAGRGAPSFLPDLASRHSRLAVHSFAHAADVSSSGGPVLHSNRTHLIFWLPSGSGLTFDPGYQSLIEAFMRGVAGDSHLTGNVFALMGQYSDSGGPAAYDSTYAGAIVDTDPLPVNGCTEPSPPPLGQGPGWTACVSDAQIESELTRLVMREGLPTGMRDIYLLITPSGLGSCFGGQGPSQCALGGQDNQGYCGYHFSTTAPTILYTVVPYNAIPGHCQSDNPRPNGSTADPAISTIAHEQAETITDPLNSAWAQGANEIADLCITNYGPALGGAGQGAYNEVIGGGHYYIQELWSNATGSCQPRAAADRAWLTAPSRALGDRTVHLVAGGSDPQGTIVQYSWDFGDGTAARGHRPDHVFTRAGRFTVTLKAIDSWGNWALSSRQIIVVAPPPPTVQNLTSRQLGPGRVRLRFTSGAAVATYQCRVDGGPWRACRPGVVESGLTAGAHTVDVRAQDTFGARSRRAAGYTFTVT